MIARLLGDTLPSLPLYDPYGRSGLVEQIELILLLGRTLAGELNPPADTFLRVASEVWRRLGEAGKDDDWLRAAVWRGDDILEKSTLPVPQSPDRAAAVIWHLAGALSLPEQSSLPALVAELEADCPLDTAV